MNDSIVNLITTILNDKHITFGLGLFILFVIACICVCMFVFKNADKIPTFISLFSRRKNRIKKINELLKLQYLDQEIKAKLQNELNGLVFACSEGSYIHKKLVRQRLIQFSDATNRGPGSIESGLIKKMDVNQDSLLTIHPISIIDSIISGFVATIMFIHALLFFFVFITSSTGSSKAILLGLCALTISTAFLYISLYFFLQATLIIPRKKLKKEIDEFNQKFQLQHEKHNEQK